MIKKPTTVLTRSELMKIRRAAQQAGRPSLGGKIYKKK